MSRTFHASRDARRIARVNRQFDKLAAARAQERADLRTVALSYSGKPQRIAFGPNAGELARVGLDERGRFVIVPVAQIIERSR